MTTALSNAATPAPIPASGAGGGGEFHPNGNGGRPCLTSLIAVTVMCLLLALAQVSLAGYQLGVGNQSIQVAFLEHSANPAFYSDDAMVRDTLPAYPTYFFRLLAPFLHYVDLRPLYLALQIATAAAALLMVYALSRSIFRSQISALAAVAILVPGHLQALAGEALYSPAFTHTFVALPIALSALALGFRGRWYWAFGIAAALFNIHALTSVFAMLMLAAGLLAEIRNMPREGRYSRIVLCGAFCFALASPTLALMVREHQTYDAQWINLMRIRSGDHSFPSTWWTDSNPDLPRFALFVALFAISLSFVPEGRREDPRRPAAPATMLAYMACGVLALFAAGYVFTDIYPVPMVIRLQPFRASRLLLVLMIVSIVHVAVAALVAGIRGRWQSSSAPVLPAAQRGMEVLAGALALATLGIPMLIGWLPMTVLVALAAALIAGRLSWRQSPVVAAALLVAILAWRKISFPLLPGFAAHVGAGSVTALGISHLLGCAVAAILAAAILALMLLRVRLRMARRMLTGAIALVACALTAAVYSALLPQKLAGDPFADVAQWAHDFTPLRTLFLAPADAGNFRIAAERSLVTDWRDGTQLYFSAGFAPTWFSRIAALKPGLALTPDGSYLLSPGENLDTLSDQQLVDLADEYQVDYILLPNPPKDRPRNLPITRAGEHYTIYEPRIDVGDAPVGVFNLALWNQGEEFMNTTVKENIEKNRKADLTVQIVDASGKPVQNVPIKLDQTKQAFVFGASLGFFEPNNISVPGDEKAPMVKPVELEKLPQIFNGSMIPFSSKWAFTEPVRGQEHWSDLDKYVDYCASHDLTVEYHHLTGTFPPWVRALDSGSEGPQLGLNFPPIKPELQKEFTRHCLDTVERYHDHIKYFQVVNEKYLMEYVPAVMKELQQKYPNNKFGISDCVRFWDGRYTASSGSETMDQYKGVDAIDWLKKQDITPDYFSVHGHFPVGLWADPQEMYKVIDYFKDRGIRVHLSEEYVDIGENVLGPVRNGITWTPQLQADYLCRYLTIAFSHPDVDMVNLWGLSPGWGFDSSAKNGSGILDDQGNPRPAWDALKKLFTETWRSHESLVSGLDGRISRPRFSGDVCDGALSLPSGKQVSATFEVPPQRSLVTLQLRLNEEKGTLEPVSH